MTYKIRRQQNDPEFKSLIINNIKSYLNAIVLKIPIIVAPRELFSHQVFGLQRLHGFDHMQVGAIDFWVFRLVEVFFGDDDPLVKEGLVDFLCIRLGNQHDVDGTYKTT